VTTDRLTEHVIVAKYRYLLGNLRALSRYLEDLRETKTIVKSKEGV